MDTRHRSSMCRLVAVLAIFAVTAVGCGGTGPVGRGPAATVNGTEISRSDVEALIAAQRELIEAGADQARGQIESGDAQFTVEDLESSLEEQLAVLAGSGSSTVSTNAASRQLDEMIQLELLRLALDEIGGEVTEADRALARTDLEAEIQQSGLTPESVPSVIMDHYIEIASVGAALEAAVPAEVGEGLGMSPEDYEQSLRDLFEENGPSYRQICFFEPVFDDEETAEQARDRIEGGEDLTSVADDLATENPSLATPLDACRTIAAGSLVEVFGEDAFTAEPGHVFPPFELSAEATGGSTAWILVVVEEVDVPTFEDVRDQLTQDFPDTTESEVVAARQQYLEDVRRSVFEEAEVTIDPRFGTWDSATGSVIPPADPAVVAVPLDDLTDPQLVDPTP